MGLTFSTHSFEGPLDLLLALISKQKVKVSEVSILDIANQYLEIVSNSDLDLSEASDFLVMTATLLEIKSRMLFPSNLVESNCLHELKEGIIQKLSEYKFFSELSKLLKTLEERSQYFLPKDPMEIEYEESIDSILKNLTVEDINDCSVKLFLSKLNQKPQSPQLIEVTRETSSVDVIINKLRERFHRNRFIKVDLVGSRRDIVATFLAVLELLKLREIILVEGEIAHEFIIKERRSN